MQKPVAKTVHLLGYFRINEPNVRIRRLARFHAGGPPRPQSAACGEAAVDGHRHSRSKKWSARPQPGGPSPLRATDGAEGLRLKHHGGLRSYIWMSRRPDTSSAKSHRSQEGIERIARREESVRFAHPIRLGSAIAAEEEELICGSSRPRAGCHRGLPFRSRGTRTSSDTWAMRRNMRLKVTGGSDFHGENKPDGASSGRRTFLVRC